MNKAFEKILERLEELRETYDEMAFVEMNTNGHTLDFECAKGKKDVMLDVKKIVQEVAEEYKDGWIPCSERMPEEIESMFAKFKGTDKWDTAMFEKISDDVNVTVEYENGTRKTMTLHTNDGKWNTKYRLANYKVIAWQPLPEPYQPKGEREA